MTLSRALRICILFIAALGLSTASSGQASHWTSVYGWVVDGATGAPVPGAQITVLTESNGIIIDPDAITTDADGYFHFVADYVFWPAVIDIAVRAPGYGTLTIQGMRLEPRDDYAFPAILLREDDYTIGRSDDDPYTLDAGEILPPPDNLQGFSQYQRSPGFDNRFWSHDIVPTTIRVARTGYGHCGYWSGGSYILYPITSVETVDFREYVKNVIPNEWIRSWHPEALKAGAVAAKMYAWWKINIGPRGVWEGQEYDVRGDTCDQVYIPGSEYPVTDDAVDATWGYMLRKEAQVSRLHYTDRVSTCERVGLSPCMGQWDSQYMAEDGADWATILMAFYGGFEISWSDGTVPQAQAGTELINNGNFNGGFSFWSRSLDTDYAVYDEGEGDFLAWKGREGDAGVINQTLNRGLPAGTTAEISLHLGNSSAATKTVNVALHRFTTAQTWSEAMRCTFTVEANSDLRRYVMRTPIQATWTNTRLYIEGLPADNLPDIHMDNVSVRHHPSLGATTKTCFSPGHGWAPTVWDFTTGSRPFAWTAAGGLTTPTLTASGLQFTAAGNDPRLNGPSLRGTNAADYPYLYVKMRSNAGTCGAVYFTTAGQVDFRESQRVNFTVTPDNTMRRYLVDMRSNAAWTGDINQLRIDPTCDDGTGTLTLERVMLWDQPEPPSMPLPAVRVEPQPGTTLAFAPDVLTWQADPNGIWYHLYLGGPDGMLIEQWYAADEVCAEGVCTLTELPAMVNGAYNWWMAVWGWDGMTAYDKTTFTIETPPPGLVDRTAPTSGVHTELTWTHDPLAMWYRVYLMRNGTVHTDKWYKAVDVCGETVCALSPRTLGNGAYNWWMVAWGPGGMGEWSKVAFTLEHPAPVAPQRFAPVDAATVSGPTVDFVWVAPDDAAWYRVFINHEGGKVHDQWLDGSIACVDGTCTHSVEFAPGTYNWWMVAWGPGGMGEWTLTTFTVE